MSSHAKNGTEMTFIIEKTETGRSQIIDHERGIFLKKISGPNIEGYYDCELLWDRAVIKFSGYPNDKVHGNPKLGEENLYDINWHIFKIFIPQKIQNKKQNILRFIEEALTAWGWNYRPEKANSVSVKFDPEM